MFHKKTLLTLAVLGLILSAGIASASAFSGMSRGFGQSSEFKNLTPEQKQIKIQEFKAEREAEHNQMDQIFANNDYDAWIKIIQSKPGFEKWAEKITPTPETFAKFAEMHKLKLAGNIEGAKAIADELGMGNKIHGKKMGLMKKMHKGGFKDVNGDGICDRLDLQK